MGARGVALHLVWRATGLQSLYPVSQKRNAKLVRFERRRGLHRESRLVASSPGDDVQGRKGGRSDLRLAFCRFSLTLKNWH